MSNGKIKKYTDKKVGVFLTCRLFRFLVFRLTENNAYDFPEEVVQIPCLWAFVVQSGLQVHGIDIGMNLEYTNKKKGFEELIGDLKYLK